MCIGETKHNPSRTPLHRTISSTRSVMCTISRRFFVSNTRYSVWLFIVPPQTSSARYPKYSVTSTDPQAARTHFQNGLDLLAEGRSADAARAFRAAIAVDEHFYDAHHG